MSFRMPINLQVCKFLTRLVLLIIDKRYITIFSHKESKKKNQMTKIYKSLKQSVWLKLESLWDKWCEDISEAEMSAVEVLKTRIRESRDDPMSLLHEMTRYQSKSFTHEKHAFVTLLLSHEFFIRFFEL